MYKTEEQKQQILERVKSLSTIPGRATSSGPPFDIAYEPISAEMLEKWEKTLEVTLPTVVRVLYTQIGNGGFGPGGGLLPLMPLSNFEVSIPAQYARLRGIGRTNHREWKERVIPFSNWGDMVFSCLDLTQGAEDPPVLRFEPTFTKADTGTYLQGRPFLGTGLIPESPSLLQWLEDWLEGKEMFNSPYVR
jgi:hypothetical protein